MEKRYEIFTKDGKGWSKWFPYSGKKIRWQLKGVLRNEYRD